MTDQPLANHRSGGPVVVALADNAVANLVGIQLAVANKPDHAIPVMLNSSLQVALVLAPA